MDALKDLYYSSGFLSLDKLWRKVKEEGLDLKKKDVKEFLDKQYTQQVNKESRKPKLYNTILAHHVDYNFQIDIMIYDRYEIHKYKYILCCVDVYSRYAQCRAMTSRDNDVIIRHLKDIFKVMGTPANINSDNEFNTTKLNAFFDKQGIIKHFSEVGEINKNAIVERFNRTLAGRIQKWRVATGKSDWVKELPHIVDAYNDSYHRTIKGKPIDVFLGKAENKQNIRFVKADFKVGDVVRIKQVKSVLGKGDYLKYSEDTYVIDKKTGNRYKLKNSRTNKDEQRTFKDYEMRKANEIETIPQPEKRFNEEEHKQKRKTIRSVKKAQKELADYTTGSEKYKAESHVGDKRQRKRKEDADFEY